MSEGLRCDLALMLLFLPAYRRLGITTAPEFLEHRFDTRTRRYFSGLALVGNVVIDMAGTLYAGSIFVNVVLPFLSLDVCVAILAVTAGGYAIAGGLRAAVYTDVLQSGLLVLGPGAWLWRPTERWADRRRLRQRRPQVAEKRLVLVGRVVAAAVLVVDPLIAPQIRRFPSLWTYLQSALSYLAPPIVAVFVGGLFSARINRHGAAAGRGARRGRAVMRGSPRGRERMATL